MDIAYLSQGKLYFKRGQGAAREIESEFGKSVQQRRLQIQQRQVLRNRGIQEMLGAAPQADGQAAEAAAPVAIVSVCNAAEGKLLYALESDNLGGLFRFNPNDDREERLFHNADFRIGHLDYSRDRDLIACTKTYPTGVTNLATLSPQSIRPLDITEGDSTDLAPRWCPGKEKAIVYQSAGLGRNGQGYVTERAPFKIEKLDFDKQEIATLAEDPKSDLLGPQMSADGWLYYIRRPYRAYQNSFNPLTLIKELFLIPVRLLYAIFQFFNRFSELFGGEPLITAGAKRNVERDRLRTLGGWFSPEKLPKKHAGEADAPALVPPTWQLVRQAAQGVPEVMAESVLAYDLAPDGTVAYTNGSGVYLIQPDGSRDRVLVGRAIESVAIFQATNGAAADR
ncbi:MAG: hypothetical protein AAFY11_02305 [Cyanobacteria bacterium J06641_5]